MRSVSAVADVVSDYCDGFDWALVVLLDELLTLLELSDVCGTGTK